MTVHLKGEQRHGDAEVIEDSHSVADYVLGVIDRHGTDSLNRLAIAIDGDTVPHKETLARGLSDTVVIRIELTDR